MGDVYSQAGHGVATALTVAASLMEDGRRHELRFAPQRKHAVLIRFTPQLLAACRQAAAQGLPMSMVFGAGSTKNVRIPLLSYSPWCTFSVVWSLLSVARMLADLLMPVR